MAAISKTSKLLQLINFREWEGREGCGGEEERCEPTAGPNDDRPEEKKTNNLTPFPLSPPTHAQACASPSWTAASWWDGAC